MTESNPSISSRRFDDILGTHVTQDDLNIPCHKLPTKMEVLRAYLTEFSVKRANKQLPDRREAATNVATKIKEIYGRAHIPTMQDNTIVYHIEKVYQDYRDICKVKTTNKRTRQGQIRLKIGELEIPQSYQYTVTHHLFLERMLFSLKIRKQLAC